MQPAAPSRLPDSKSCGSATRRFHKPGGAIGGGPGRVRRFPQPPELKASNALMRSRQQLPSAGEIVCGTIRPPLSVHGVSGNPSLGFFVCNPIGEEIFHSASGGNGA